MEPSNQCRKRSKGTLPAQAGIQLEMFRPRKMDPGLRRGDIGARGRIGWGDDAHSPAPLPRAWRGAHMPA
jgi:hypothetical protein